MLNAKQKDFIVADWAGVSQVDCDTARIPLFFSLPGGGRLRLLVPVEWAQSAACALIHQAEVYGRWKCQRDMSSGRPSVDGSTVPGQDVVPPDSDSQAT